MTVSEVRAITVEAVYATMAKTPHAKNPDFEEILRREVKTANSRGCKDIFEVVTNIRDALTFPVGKR